MTTITYEKAYDALIWNRKRAIDTAREAMLKMAADADVRIIEETATFTTFTRSVPPIEHTFGERPGFSYWVIQGSAITRPLTDAA